MDRPTLDPRTNFHTDLKHFIQQQVSTPNKTRTPIILGDWNKECSGTSTSQKLCDSLGLVDVRRYQNLTHLNFKTYQRGQRQIDFALTTPRLASLVVNMVFKPFFYRTSGDHYGLYIGFDINSLFTTTIPPFGSSYRGFTSKDGKAVTTHLTGPEIEERGLVLRGLARTDKFCRDQLSLVKENEQVMNLWFSLSPTLIRFS